MAIDWGNVFSGAVDIAQGQIPGGGAAPGSGIWAGPGIATSQTVPAQVTVDTRTGKVTPCRRRRRRRLLTPTDMADLASLQTLVGKGSDAMKFAVTKAVRR